MLWEIFTFELKYRLKRPATYLYFLILFLMSFLFITTDVIRIGGGAGNVFHNSPFVINQTVLVLSIFASLMCSAVMGVPIFRDFDHRMHEIYYTMPIRKFPYLVGRFLGSYLTVLFIYSGILLGIFIGSLMPWVDATELCPNQFSAYLQPFLTIIIPNTFFMGSVFFVVGALSRNLFAIYVQGILFLILWILSGNLLSDIDNRTVAALIDPIGIRATGMITKAWATAQKNTLIIPLSNELLYNRILWSTIGLIVFLIGYKLFQFSSQPLQLWGKKKSANTTAPQTEQFTYQQIKFPTIEPKKGFASTLTQLKSVLNFEVWAILKSPIFIIIVLIGVFNLLINLYYSDRMYDASLYPTTSHFVEAANGSFALFMIIIITFYVGELVWRERSARIDQIANAMPIKNATLLIGKLFAMLLILSLLQIVIMLSSMLMQTIKGYYNYEILLYLKYLFGYSLVGYGIYVLIAFFIHTLVNNKFMGHACVILLYIYNIAMITNGYNHNLYLFGGSPSITLSDMNGFGHFVKSFAWFSAYWYAFGFIALTLALLLWVRTTETSFKARFTEFRNRLSAFNIALLLSSIVTFIFCGGFIYYNTNKLNKFLNTNQSRAEQALFETQYRKYLKTPQPRIYAINSAVDLFPSTRKVSLKGTYKLKNTLQTPIDTIFYILNDVSKIKNKQLSFSKPNNVIIEDNNLGFFGIKLQQALAPNDSLIFNFNFDIENNGFENDGGTTSITYNGSFLNNYLLPVLGYNEDYEINNPDDRKKEHLPEKPTLAAINDSSKYNQNYISSDADWIDFETTLSTEPDQIAIAPGYLQKEWIDNNRRYFNYKMDTKILNFYSFLSAKYQVKKDTWNNINLEIYYHPSHTYNIDKMMESMKSSLDYFNKNFTPYQFKQVRIIEFPRYQSFAQSFPNTIPFSEGIGFILQNDPETNIDLSYYVTAHEVAHQWWGHQVVGCPVQGVTLFSESLAQYSALMVMKHKYGSQTMRKFLKYELEAYLSGRRNESKKENPLILCENQQYIHYRKGSVVLYTLQDYLGEQNVNKALQNFLNKYKFSNPPYPNAYNFYEFIKAETPDSLKTFVDELFTKIVLYDNKCTNASYSEVSEGKFKVQFSVLTNKILADSIGNETTMPINEWLPVGVLGEDDKLLATEKHKFSGTDTLKFEMIVNEKPLKAGIDPINMLIDKDAEDNVKKVEKQ